MANILLKYLEDRHKTEESKGERKAFGPVITISRYFGCPANLCASDLAELLNEMDSNKKEPWKVISKEILDKAAYDLGLAPEKIEYIFKFEKRSTIDDIFEALSSKYYKSDRKIRKTIKEVISAFGEKGRVIIVGRAGAAILRDLPNSLHVKLIAPLDYRIEGVAKRHQISKNEAKKLIQDMDKKRKQLNEEYFGRKMELTDYDVVFNTMTMKTNEIAEIILSTAKIKGLI